MAARAAPGSLIGVDVGSTRIKAALLAPGSGVVYVARRPTPTYILPGGAEHDPEELLAAVESAVAECAAVAASGRPLAGGVAPPLPAPPLPAPPLGPVLGIGIASMAEAGVPLDARGRSIGRMIAWFDARSAPQADWLAQRVGPAALFARTGLRPEPKYTLPKLLWLREHEARAMARAAHWAGVAELVAHRLTGELATNASLACRTQVFDVAARRWDPELLGLAGMTPEQMPRVLPLGEAAGRLTEAAAQRLGVAAGTPVAVAGHDHMVGALGAGVVRPGDALDSMGSAEMTALVSATPTLRDEARTSGFSCGCHAVDGQWYLAGGLQAAGALIEYFIDHLMPAADLDATRPAGGDATPDRADPSRYRAFLDLLAAAPAAPSRRIVLPYLRGRTAPRPDPRANLEILMTGVGPGTTGIDTDLPELAAAFVEAAAFHVRWMLEELERVAATKPRRIRFIGGGTRIPRWIAAKAALGPAAVEVARTEEAVALGAALVAGLASGVYADLSAALVDAAPADRIVPNRPSRIAYESAYRDIWLPAVLAGSA